LEEQSPRLVGLRRKLNKNLKEMEAKILLSIDEMIASQTALTQEDRARLMELLAEWQLLSDLSFADLILWTPKRKDYQSWPDGHLAIAHIRPTTAATVFAHDVIGNVINWGSNPRIDHSLSTGEIDRDSEAELVGEILIKERQFQWHSMVV